MIYYFNCQYISIISNQDIFINQLFYGYMSKKLKFEIDFIGIGAAKSATYWIFQCLREHPEICFSSKKEIHFFDIPYNYRKGFKHYYSFFKHCPKNKIKGEFTPGYLVSPNAPDLIFKHFPNVKIIACLRNPIEKIYSQFRFLSYTKRRYHIYKTFEDAILRNRNLIEHGFYYKQLKRYYDIFPKENILITFYNDLKRNPREFIKNIFIFLNVNDRDFIPPMLNKKVNITGIKVVKNRIPFFNSFAYKIRERIIRDSSLEKFLKKITFNMPLEKILGYNKKTTRINKTKGVIYTPPIKETTRKYLNRIYREDIKKLEKLLHKDLSYWK